MSLRDKLHDEVSKIENYLRGRFDDSVSADLGGLVSTIHDQVDNLLVEVVQDCKADSSILGDAADDLLSNEPEDDGSVETGGATDASGDSSSTTKSTASKTTAAKSSTTKK